MNAPTGSLNVVLPVIATLGGQSVAGGGPVPTIRITDPNVFANPPPVFAAENFQELLNFNSLTPQSVIGLLNQLSSWFDLFRSTSVFQASIPFTSRTLGDLIDLKDAFLSRLTPLLETSPGEAAFNNAQELAQRLASLLGGSPSAVSYNPATNLLTYAIQFTHNFATQQTPVAFGVDLGKLAGIQSNSRLTAFHRDLAEQIALGKRQPLAVRRERQVATGKVGVRNLARGELVHAPHVHAKAIHGDRREGDHIALRRHREGRPDEGVRDASARRQVEAGTDDGASLTRRSC